SEADLRAQRRVVDAFLAAVQKGDFEGIVAVLDPDIVLRADGGAAKGLSRVVRWRRDVASEAAAFSKLDLASEVVRLSGLVGLLSRLPDERLFSVIGFTVAGGRVVEMDILADAERLARLDLTTSRAT